MKIFVGDAELFTLRWRGRSRVGSAVVGGGSDSRGISSSAGVVFARAGRAGRAGQLGDGIDRVNVGAVRMSVGAIMVKIALVDAGGCSSRGVGMCRRGQPGRRPIKLVVAVLGSGAVIAGRGVPLAAVVKLVLILLFEGELVQRH